MSAPSLHREPTDSLITFLGIQNVWLSVCNMSARVVPPLKYIVGLSDKACMVVYYNSI